MIFIINGSRRLCQDKRWREFASFGTYKECVKTYKRRGIADRFAQSQNAILEYRAKQHPGDKVLDTVKVVDVPAGYTVDAVGGVFDENDLMIGTLEKFGGDVKV